MIMKKLCIMTICTLLISCGGSGTGSSLSDPVGEMPGTDVNSEVVTEHLAGGDATVQISNSDAFSQPSRNLIENRKIITFNLGNDFFENPWIAGNSSTSSRDGLGGLFNNNACQDCHVRDGRGHAPIANGLGDGIDFSTILIRAIKSDISDEQRKAMRDSLLASVPDTSVGGQLQHDAIPGVMKEVDLKVSYEFDTVEFEDGFQVELRKPIWQLTSNYAGSGYDFNIDSIFSVRVAPQMIGLGLLALIPEADIKNKADVTDENNDGISGKVNLVWSIENQQVELGRFGWKAGQPSLLEQSASAFVNDMGLTSRLIMQENCLEHQTDCLLSENGNGDSVNSYDYEVADKILEAVTFYSSHLAVPQRRNSQNAKVLAGKALFEDSGCISCHTPKHQTQFSQSFPELSEQTIYPYTDMLLHDMGEDLADFTRDNVPANKDIAIEYLASAYEWRTPPLWGLGLVQTVDPNATFLHDGRARTILEAILWHSGEAHDAKQAVLKLGANQREELLMFLNDL